MQKENNSSGGKRMQEVEDHKAESARALYQGSDVIKILTPESRNRYRTPSSYSTRKVARKEG